jgi:2-polyprenyl-3-methyl-5-hydroxy-6-metoxy-1,4-benzoquinol methylase
MVCPICNSEEIFLKYESNIDSFGKNYLVTDGSFGAHADIFKCKRCGLGWIDGANFKREAVSSYFTDGLDETYEKERKNRKKTADILIRKIKKIKPCGRLLDIGCYSGIFLEVAQKYNYDIFGIEASSSALEIARQKVIGDFRSGMAEDVLSQFPDRYFDIITLFDVLEHLGEPKEILLLIKSKLKDDGLLVFSTPDFSSLVAKIQREKWHAILPHHLYYFSIKNLKILLRENGFRNKKVCYIGRHFTADYLSSQMPSVNKILAKIFFIIIKIFRLNGLVIPINLFDQLLIFAKKE